MRQQAVKHLSCGSPTGSAELTVLPRMRVRGVPGLWPGDHDGVISSLMGMSPVMSSSTLDLSPLDIKWGILDQEPDTIKREPEKSNNLSLQNDLQ